MDTADCLYKPRGKKDRKARDEHRLVVLHRRYVLALKFSCFLSIIFGSARQTNGCWRNCPLESFSFRVEARRGPLRVRSSPLGLHTICQGRSWDQTTTTTTTTTHDKKGLWTLRQASRGQERALDPEASLAGEIPLPHSAARRKI